MRVLDVEKNVDARMKKVVQVLSEELRGIRTGRATAAMLEGIRVEYYGAMLPINQIANINIPQPKMIEIKVWDENAVQPVEKAIQKANIGFTPNTEGKTIRLAVPSLTAESRQNLVKRIHDIVEEFRVEIRNIRRESNEEIKKMKKDGDISEDELFRGQGAIQKVTDKHINEVDEILKKKEKELMEE